MGEFFYKCNRAKKSLAYFKVVQGHKVELSNLRDNDGISKNFVEKENKPILLKELGKTFSKLRCL